MQCEVLKIVEKNDGGVHYQDILFGFLMGFVLSALVTFLTVENHNGNSEQSFCEDNNFSFKTTKEVNPGYVFCYNKIEKNNQVEKVGEVFEFNLKKYIYEKNK